MQIDRTEIPDILLINPQVFGDERGFFMETYVAAELAKVGVIAPFVQDNHSGSRGGTLRGLHYQIRQPQGKLVRCVVGEVFDVVVDLRRNSPSLGKWLSFTISANNRKQVWAPPGFAHGFYVLSDWAEIIYKATDYYAPQWERSLLWNDPDIGIPWPIQEGHELLISPKDLKGVPYKQVDLYE